MKKHSLGTTLGDCFNIAASTFLPRTPYGAGGHGGSMAQPGCASSISRCGIPRAEDSILGTRTSPAQRPSFSGEETDARVKVAPSQAGSPEHGLFLLKAKNPPEDTAEGLSAPRL